MMAMKRAIRSCVGGSDPGPLSSPSGPKVGFEVGKARLSGGRRRPPAARHERRGNADTIPWRRLRSGPVIIPYEAKRCLGGLEPRTSGSSFCWIKEIYDHWHWTTSAGGRVGWWPSGHRSPLSNTGVHRRTEGGPRAQESSIGPICNRRRCLAQDLCTQGGTPHRHCISQAAERSFQEQVSRGNDNVRFSTVKIRLALWLSFDLSFAFSYENIAKAFAMSREIGCVKMKTSSSPRKLESCVFPPRPVRAPPRCPLGGQSWDTDLKRPRAGEIVFETTAVFWKFKEQGSIREGFEGEGANRTGCIDRRSRAIREPWGSLLERTGSSSLEPDIYTYISYLPIDERHRRRLDDRARAQAASAFHIHNTVNENTTCNDPLEEIVKAMSCIEAEDIACVVDSYAPDFVKMHNGKVTDTPITKDFWSGTFMLVDIAMYYDVQENVATNQASLRYTETVTTTDGSVKTFKTSINRTLFAQKCFVFSSDSDEEVIEKVQIVCDLFRGSPSPVGPYKTAHIVGCLRHGGELLEGTMNFAMLP
ncbi:hypothetical protein THAOC_29108, partial [Thalassiosira oceanica]